jgi:hypothetical protein
VPVLDDPKILAAHLDFIKRLGARYDGHPDITRLDLGSVGWWGEWHMSRSSNASMPTPETQKKIVDAYRPVLKELKHPSTVRPGDTFPLAMKWQNVGSAPCYKPYRLAYKLSNDEGYEQVFVGKVTVNKWLPGSIELFTEEFFEEPEDLPPGDIHDVADSIALPEDIPAGECGLSVGVVDVKTEQPIVQLGIKGRGENGWYPVSKIQINR